MADRLPALAPFGAVLNDPICQRSLKSNVATGLLGFNPLVPQDLLAFRLKFPIERRVLQQIVSRGRLFRFVRHNREYKLLRAQEFSRASADDNNKLRFPAALVLCSCRPRARERVTFYWSNIA